MTDKSRIGDRVEGAIERRSDVEGEIARGSASAPGRLSRIRRPIFWTAVTGVSLYLVAPSVLDVAGSWKDFHKLAPIWLVVMVVTQALAMASLWDLQRLAIGTRAWYAVATSQLAGNALAKVAPGGGAMGAAIQYRMLIDAGLRQRPVISGLTSSNLLTFAVVLAMPVLAIPTLIRGNVDRGLVEAAIAGIVLFIIIAAVSTSAAMSDRLLRWIGRLVQSIRNRIRRRASPLKDLPDRLVHERDRILATLGPRWKHAVIATIARWLFDYATLLAALAAVGANARPGLVLLAFCAAQLLAQIPVTPGGLGFVEAGLTAMLTLAGVGAGAAVLATFAYRLASYWLPLPVGLAAWAMHRRRFGTGEFDEPADLAQR